LIIETIWWTGLAPWEIEFPFPSSLIFTFLLGYTPGQALQGAMMDKVRTLLSSAKSSLAGATVVSGPDNRTVPREKRAKAKLTVDLSKVSTVYVPGRGGGDGGVRMRQPH